MTATNADDLVAPHGGILTECIVDGNIPAFEERIRALPSLTLDDRELADLELLAIGAASPLTGFVGPRDYDSILKTMRLASGLVWPLPLALSVPEVLLARLRKTDRAALYDGTGRPWGWLEISEIFERDPSEEARRLFGTESREHPWVAYLLSKSRWCVGGAVRVLPLPSDRPFAARRLMPHAVRACIREHGWRTVAGFNTRNPIHRAHEHLTKLALEVVDGIVIHPAVGQNKSDDLPASVRFRTYEQLLERFYPPGRTLLCAYPGATRWAGPREALFHALVRKNYGMTHFIVGRDHAGPGLPLWGPYESHKIFDDFAFSEIQITPLRFDAAFYCRRCSSFATARSCPHGREHRVEISGSDVRKALTNGSSLPEEVIRPEMAELLRAHYTSDVSRRAPLATPPTSRGSSTSRKPSSGRSFIVWFTGLSGSGKTTLARVLGTRIPSPVQVLDGDELRSVYVKTLGFSREDREVAIRHAGFVARLLARNGVATLVASISAFASARAEVRRLAEADGITFIEVFTNADLETLKRLDVKGLYKQALAGRIQNFTGISDPYEPPTDPEVLVPTHSETVEQSVERILAALRSRKLLTDVEDPPSPMVRPSVLFFSTRAERS